MKCQKYKTTGKVKRHAVDRLIGQYGFNGGRSSARKFLRRCMDLLCDNGDKNCRKEIPGSLLKEAGIEDRKIFVEISFGIVENVKELKA